MNKATARYWRQVHKVQSMTGASSAVARQAVKTLRARDITTAAATARHARITSRAVKSIDVAEPSRPGKPYRDLDDWIDSWEDYEGDYDYEDYETSADY